jgi:uncharacterized protein
MPRRREIPRFDPAQLTDRPMVFEETLGVEAFPRLLESLANEEGELRYRVSAGLDRERRRVVSCIIEGFVFLTCQKSLEAFRYDVSVEDRLVLVSSEQELPPIEEESDAEDYLVADGPLDLRDLVEDAVLLALPMVPRKPGLEDAPGEGGKAPAPGDSPFAALAGLKKQTK